jgi:hypothetical protein
MNFIFLFACQQNSGTTRQSSVPHRNFKAVVEMLSQWLQAKPAYDSTELGQLLLMICRLGLDHAVLEEHCLYEVQVCLASILCCFEVILCVCVCVF